MSRPGTSTAPAASRRSRCSRALAREQGAAVRARHPRRGGRGARRPALHAARRQARCAPRSRSPRRGDAAGASAREGCAVARTAGPAQQAHAAAPLCAAVLLPPAAARARRRRSCSRASGSPSPSRSCSRRPSRRAASPAPPRRSCEPSSGRRPAAARAGRRGLRRSAARARGSAPRRQAGRAAAGADRDRASPPNGRRVTVDLAGTDVSLAVLDGLARTLPLTRSRPGGIGLSSASAQALGVSASAARRSAGDAVCCAAARSRCGSPRCSAPKPPARVSGALVAVMPLARLQRLAGLPRRDHPHPRADRAGPRRTRSPWPAKRSPPARLTVAPADQDVALLDQALRPERPGERAVRRDRRAARVPARVQRDPADGPRAPPGDRRPAPGRHQAQRDRPDRRSSRRCASASPRARSASRVGYALSVWRLSPVDRLSRGGVHARRAPPSSALGRCCSPALGGVAATCLASGVPLLDLRRGRAARRRLPRGGRARQRARHGTHSARCSPPRSRCSRSATAAVRAGALGGDPRGRDARARDGARGAAGVRGGARRRRAGSARAASASPRCRSRSPRCRRRTLRSLALAATGAVALFGSVALGGARDDLLRGIRSFADELRRRRRRLGIATRR